MSTGGTVCARFHQDKGPVNWWFVTRLHVVLALLLIELTFLLLCGGILVLLVLGDEIIRVR